VSKRHFKPFQRQKVPQYSKPCFRACLLFSFIVKIMLVLNVDLLYIVHHASKVNFENIIMPQK